MVEQKGSDCSNDKKGGFEKKHHINQPGWKDWASAVAALYDLGQQSGTSGGYVQQVVAWLGSAFVSIS
jgi:hypothetical protein